MMRNLRALWLAIMAVMAMSAVVASATASADEITSETSPTFMNGNQVGFGDVLTTTAGVVKCKEIVYLTGAIATPTTAITVTPVYPLKALDGTQNCTGFGFPAEVLTNGCAYKFTINGGGATTGGFDIICPENKEITMIATSGPTTKCVLHIPPQNISSGVTYSNSGAGTTREISIGMNFANTVSYSHTPGEGVGKCTSGSGKGSYVGAATLGGLTHVGFFLS
jgi:hypothetical protein